MKPDDKITDQDIKKIRKAIQRKLTELNGSALVGIDQVNKDHYNVKVARPGIKFKMTHLITEVIGIEMYYFNRIMHGSMKNKDENYQKLINFFKL